MEAKYFNSFGGYDVLFDKAVHCVLRVCFLPIFLSRTR
jgi:hypothetical protein